MIPRRSPFGLIQEDLAHSRWLVLVSCILLNLTNRKQVEDILPEFMERWPDAATFLKADPMDVGRLIEPLGLVRRRVVILRKMTEMFLAGGWEDARELPGIGEYGGAAYDMFCRGIIPDECPRDGALSLYWEWAHEREYGRKKAER